MRELSIRRQSSAGPRQKAKWALYEKKHFRQLIEDLIALIDALIAQAQKKLCEAEVSEIDSTEGLAVLKDVAATEDKYLEAVIENVLETQVGKRLSHDVSVKAREFQDQAR